MIGSTFTGFGYLALLVAIAGCSVASAADGGNASTNGALANSDGPPHKPPQEAFDACKSHSEGDACSVTFNGHTMDGTCRKGPNGESDLACAPAHPPGPPPEAVEACKGSAEGADCSMTFHGETVTGTCRKGPGDSSVVACAPAHPQGPPPSSNSTLSDSALERKLNRLERDIHGA